MLLQFIRNFHCGRALWASEGSVLAQLRKRTGYTFSNCKKALEMHNNDLDKAENWLNKQAQELGWSKASKLADRATTQGLIALKYDDQHATLVEINCETDFVSRNEKFRAMAEEAANACFKVAHTGEQAHGYLTKMCLDTERLRNLHTPQGKTLGEQLALMIGIIGENAILKRAECWKAIPGVIIAGYTHPSIADSSFSTGRFGSILAYKCDQITEETPTIVRQLCQHIVGMNPLKIGKVDDDKPAENLDDETCLIYQEFVADTNVTINDVLKEHHIEVVDFERFECGQSLQNLTDKDGQALENVQTCQ